MTRRKKGKSKRNDFFSHPGVPDFRQQSFPRTWDNEISTIHCVERVKGKKKKTPSLRSQGPCNFYFLTE